VKKTNKSEGDRGEIPSLLLRDSHGEVLVRITVKKAEEREVATVSRVSVNISYQLWKEEREKFGPCSTYNPSGLIGGNKRAIKKKRTIEFLAT